MKKLLSILFILFTLGSNQLTANDHITISLLTCSSGKEAFSAWGHSAIRIVDPVDNIDIVCNFGLFDFDTPNFYLKFVKGKLNYKLGVHSTQQFYLSYLREDRQIIEQKLNLAHKDEIKIIRRLEYLYKPENRYYLYSFVGKNCTSELRDIILENVETNFQNELTNKTHRQQINEFLQNRLWLKFGMSLIMGYKVDRKITKFESMFLPDYLYHGLKNIKTKNQPLVESENIFNPVNTEKKSYPLFISPLFVLSILFLVTIFFKSTYFQNTILLIVGVTGLVIFVVSLFSEHPELKYNLNYLWINPLYIVTVLLGAFNKNKAKVYITIFLQFLFMVIVFIWLFNIQDYNIAFIPLFFMLTLLNYRIFKKYKLFSSQLTKKYER
ncbi:MAG TPA: DUF4105 domain-containing protein [Bacteroidales bacterium]|nr:DUF4105 domain-containing protein [Bacteroidales bacterium]